MPVDRTALEQTLAAARERLLSARVTRADGVSTYGHWEGRLSGSALSTATAVAALALYDQARQRGTFRAMVDRGLAWLAEHQNTDGGWGDTVDSPSNISTTILSWAAFGIGTGLAVRHQTVVARVEVWLRRAVGDLTPPRLAESIRAVYGNDRTFAVPILTMCALSGRFGTGRDAWCHIPSLPFEVAVVPRAWLRRLGPPVVSYALPALIAIGQARHHHRPVRNPVVRWLRRLTRGRTLRVLQSIQPSSGGFLEAAPLTAFVVMSLASIGQAQHPVTARAVAFLTSSMHDDGSWPIDTNLATWVTTLSIAALQDSTTPQHSPALHGGTPLSSPVAKGATRGVAPYPTAEHPLAGNDDAGPLAERDAREKPAALRAKDRTCLRDWLLGRQHRKVHPYTNAAPGGWAWTDLSGGVPDADDTAGALLALWHLVASDGTSEGINAEVRSAAAAGVRWLLDLQNRDGGMPTFCRGWGKLPFDRSAPDLTAHALRAWDTWQSHVESGLRTPNRTCGTDLPVGQETGWKACPTWVALEALGGRIRLAMRRAVRYLVTTQRSDGSWVPLWFGNQGAPRLENPVYGTSRVLRAAHVTPEGASARGAWIVALNRGLAWLLSAQNADGGWGGAPKVPSSMEETALAVEALADEALAHVAWPTPRPVTDSAAGSVADPTAGSVTDSMLRGCAWLIEHTQRGTQFDPAPIGLYFARLWYAERLYPLIFTVSALQRARDAITHHRADRTRQTNVQRS